MKKLKTLLAAAGLAALALSGCTEYQSVGATGFACKKGEGGYWEAGQTARLTLQKGDQRAVVNYFKDRNELEIYNLSYQVAVDAVQACERAIDNLPKLKK